MRDDRGGVRVPLSKTKESTASKASEAGSPNVQSFEMSQADCTDFTLDELSEYVCKLSYGPISRHPAASFCLGLLQAGQPAKLPIGPKEARHLRAELKGMIKHGVSYVEARPNLTWRRALSGIRVGGGQ